VNSTRLCTLAALATALAFPLIVGAAEGAEMAMFDQLDASKDDSINMDEAARSAQVTADFRQIDTDANGAISREEWRAYFGSTGARGSGAAPSGSGSSY
jgi:hypothetical protein